MRTFIFVRNPKRKIKEMKLQDLLTTALRAKDFIFQKVCLFQLTKYGEGESYIDNNNITTLKNHIQNQILLVEMQKSMLKPLLIIGT